jgi:hypothetical protein
MGETLLLTNLLILLLLLLLGERGFIFNGLASNARLLPNATPVTSTTSPIQTKKPVVEIIRDSSVPFPGDSVAL